MHLHRLRRLNTTDLCLLVIDAGDFDLDWAVTGFEDQCFAWAAGQGENGKFLLL